MVNGIIFAILAGISLGMWSFFHDKSTGFINPIVGATLVSFFAMIIGLIIIYINKEVNVEFSKININYKAIIFLLFVGIFAFFIDFFTLKTFSTGIHVSVGFPIIIIISIVTSLILGRVILGEIISYRQIFGILLSIVAVYYILG